jgi:predicted GIY-YIG superfamily endonuclease
MPSHFYILRLQSGALYIGATKDLKKRCERHLGGFITADENIKSNLKLAIW